MRSQMFLKNSTVVQDSPEEKLELIKSKQAKILDLEDKIANWDIPRLGFANRRRLEHNLRELKADLNRMLEK